MPSAESPNRELCSWKEIAAYLGVSVKTAQLWERDRSLPVRRMPGGRSQVRIDISSLEAWRLDPQPPGKTASPVAVAPSPFLPGHWLVLAGLVALTLATAFYYNRRGRPDRVGVEQHDLVVADSEGRLLWRKSFPGLNSAAYIGRERAWIRTIEDKPLVLFAAEFDNGVSDLLIAYDAEGNERWRFAAGRDVKIGGEDFRVPFHIQHVVVDRLGRDTKPSIIVTVAHHRYFPCQIAVLNTDGIRTGEYWHSGHLQHAVAADLRGNGYRDLILAGINNVRNTATLIVLDPDNMNGASREDASDSQFQDMPVAHERARIIFPRSCMNQALEKFLDITELRWQNDTLSVDVQHRLNPADATVFYEFNRDLTLRNVGVGTSFERAHLQLRAQGVLNHDLNAAEIRGLYGITDIARLEAPLSATESTQH